VIVFEPVTHTAHFIDVKGEPTRDRQNLAMTFNKIHAPTGTTEMRPGPLRLTLDNRTDVRTLPSVWIAGDALHHLLGKRRPFLTAKRLLTNQAFRDIYRTDTLDVDQGLKITSLTFLFTDLKGSTALYDRVGDIVAYDLVREHFRLLQEIVASEGGRLLKPSATQ
jgi:class 3 adenylate cyclase